MKKFSLFFLIFLFITGAGFVFAQNEAGKPEFIKATYFDVSPPLRDMVLQQDNLLPAQRDEEFEINKTNKRSRSEWKQSRNFIDPVRQGFFGQVNTDTTIENFDGVSAAGFLPPDTDGDVGPNNYFQVVNVRYAIYDKSGNKILGPSSNSSIFSGMPNNSNDGDAIVLYDEAADRWLFSQFSLPTYPNGPFYENVAISTTPDPTGTWYRYQFQFTDLPDYPKLSVWEDAYYMTIRRFASGSGNWLGPAVVAMDRTKMLAGDQSAGMVKFNLPSSAEGPLAADCDGEFPPAGTPEYISYLVQGNPASMRIYEFHVDFSNVIASTLTLAYTVPISSFTVFGNGNDVPQKGTSRKLDAFSRKGLMHRMQFRKFSDHWSMVANTTVNVSGVAGIRWMELRNSGMGWELFQEGTYSPDNNWRWMGSIAMDTSGNIALGFSISSSSMFPSIRYTGRVDGDPLGQMTIAEKGIIDGGGSQTDPSGRWGDYSAMVVDPSENAKFWYTQEYYTTTSIAGWKTRIASFSFANILSVHASASPTLVCPGGTSQLDVNTTGGSGTYTYSWTSIPPGFTSTQKNPTVTPAVTTKYIVDVNDGASSKTDTTEVTVGGQPAAFAGNDTLFCVYVPTFQLNATASNYLMVDWSTSGDGVFLDPGDVNATYDPGLQDHMSGSVVLTLTAYPLPGCTDPATDDITVMFDPCTGIPGLSGQDFSVSVKPNPSDGHIVVAITGTADKQFTLQLTDLQGKILYSDEFRESGNTVSKKIDVLAGSRGVYLLKVMTNHQVRTEKVVVY